MGHFIGAAGPGPGMTETMYRSTRALSTQPHLPTGPGAKRRRNRSRGQSLVEFAVVLPIFLLILCGIFDFGFALYSRMSVINAAREGARAASVAPDHTTIDSTATARAVAAAQSSGLTMTNSDVSVTCVATASPSSCNFNTQTGAIAGDSLRVTIDYSYRSFFPFLFGQSFDLSSSVQMVVEQ
jgi:Flp pilus assembly protein TadG